MIHMYLPMYVKNRRSFPLRQEPMNLYVLNEGTLLNLVEVIIVATHVALYYNGESLPMFLFLHAVKLSPTYGNTINE